MSLEINVSFICIMMAFNGISVILLEILVKSFNPLIINDPLILMSFYDNLNG